MLRGPAAISGISSSTTEISRSTSHSDAPRRFVDDQIGALSKAGLAEGGQLSHTLEVLAARGGSKAGAAKRLHVRRQSLNYRLDQISKLLDVDLDDPKPLTTLAVALTARRMV